MYQHLLIDMKNLLYRSLFAGYYDPAFKRSGRDYMSIVLHFISAYTQRFQPKQVHAFWDTPRSKVWRKATVPHYKEHRNELYQSLSINVETEIKRLALITAEILQGFGIHQYYVSGMEADDLIYAFCILNRRDKTVIVTSDGDYKQIIYHHSHVDLHNPLDKKKERLVAIPTCDPAIYKSLVGDKSDNLKGYFRISKKKAEVYAQDVKARVEFFGSPKAVVKNDMGELVVVGDQRFRENMSIIDMSLCPGLLSNMMYISHQMVKPAKFSSEQISQTVSKHRLNGITTEMTRFTAPFIMVGST